MYKKLVLLKRSSNYCLMKLKLNIIISYSESSLFKKYETEDKTSGCIVSKNIKFISSLRIFFHI